MGTIYADIIIQNVHDVSYAQEGIIPETQIRSKLVRAKVKTDTRTFVIPIELFNELGLEQEAWVLAKRDDGNIEQVILATSIEICFENRHAIINPLVLGDEVLIGATTLQLLDVVLDPVQEKMSVNPESPEMGMYRV